MPKAIFPFSSSGTLWDKEEEQNWNFTFPMPNITNRVLVLLQTFFHPR